MILAAPESDETGASEHEDDRAQKREGQTDRVAQRLDCLAARISPEPCEFEACDRLWSNVGRLRLWGRRFSLFRHVDARGFREIADEAILERSAAALFDELLWRADGEHRVRMHEMRSQRSASFMKLVVTKIVTPSSRERSISVRQNASRAIGSTPEGGSSRMRIEGSWSTATASWRRCLRPSGSLSGRELTTDFKS
jgi:hypothetical protein